MNKELKNLIKAYEDDIKCSNFAPIVKEAIEKDLLEQLLLDTLSAAGILVPPDIVFDALCDKCIEASKKLTSEEKEKTKARAAALVNAHQILVFKALLQ
jgi:hypothetical protein